MFLSNFIKTLKKQSVRTIFWELCQNVRAAIFLKQIITNCKTCCEFNPKFHGRMAHAQIPVGAALMRFKWRRRESCPAAVRQPPTPSTVSAIAFAMRTAPRNPLYSYFHFVVLWIFEGDNSCSTINFIFVISSIVSWKVEIIPICNRKSSHQRTNP